MQRTNRLALFLIVALLSGSIQAKRDTRPFKDRMVEMKDKAKEKIAAWLVYLPMGNESRDAQLKRLEVYKKFKERDWWLGHPKRWITYIVTGRMPVKNPDSRIRDTEYVHYYLIYKELDKGASLTDDEIEAARAEAMDLLEEF